MNENSEISQPRVQTLKNWILNYIPYEKAAFRNALEDKDFTEIVRAYINYASRQVVSRKRAVRIHQAFWASNIALSNRDAIMDIKREIEQGEDLQPRLSRKLKREGYNPKIGWKGKDFALNAYGVHHLHLKKGIGGGNSKELIFIEFRPDIATMIFAGDHSSFDKPELEEVILKHRADIGNLVLKVALPAIQTGREVEERHRLARAGRFATVANLDGQAVISANITNAGTSTRYAIHANKVLRYLSKLEHEIDKKEWLEKIFKHFDVIPPKQPDFEWMFEGTSLILIEKSTQTCFLIVVSPQGLSDNLLNRKEVP